MPSRHLEPVPRDAHALSLVQPLKLESPTVPSVPLSGRKPLSGETTQLSEPFASVHWYPPGQPELEQSPAWHWSSAPQLKPEGQSLGCVQVEDPPYEHVPSGPQLYPDGQSLFE